MNEDFTTVISESLSPLAPIPADTPARISPPPFIKAILFDIYGTLLISGTGDIGVASGQRDILGIGQIMSESGFPVIIDDGETLVPALLEKTIREWHRAAREKGIDYPEVEIRDIWNRVLEELEERDVLVENGVKSSIETLALRHELEVNPVWPMPGYPKIIGELAASGFRIGIVSNAQFYTPLILEALAGKNLREIGFEERLCAWSYQLLRAKPSPEVFTAPLEALREDGISPAEVLYVGNDMLNDVTAASHAGCRTALFAGDRRSLRLREGDERVDRLPDMVITDLNQLEILMSEGASDGQA